MSVTSEGILAELCEVFEGVDKIVRGGLLCSQSQSVPALERRKCDCGRCFFGRLVSVQWAETEMISEEAFSH